MELCRTKFAWHQHSVELPREERKDSYGVGWAWAVLPFRSSQKITRQIRMTRDIGSVPMLLFASVPLSFLNWIIMSVGKRCRPSLYLGTPTGERNEEGWRDKPETLSPITPWCRMGERESQLGPGKWTTDWMVIFRNVPLSPQGKACLEWLTWLLRLLPASPASAPSCSTQA